uniref:Uncharacterized protein n=1 Tax=Brassica campestris TaxID=3711 RepID=A0A3P5ZLS3_BRACM|nr:unnamed protein product [Brassica rapa]
MTWSEEVQVLYCPFQVDGRHWIGVLETLLQPFGVLMPFLIHLNGGDALNEAATKSPLQLTRLDLPICCEQKGMLSIAAKTYAVEAFACFNPEYLKEFPKE